MGLRYGAKRIEQGGNWLLNGQLVDAVARQVSVGFARRTAGVAEPQNFDEHRCGKDTGIRAF